MLAKCKIQLRKLFILLRNSRKTQSFPITVKVAARFVSCVILFLKCNGVLKRQSVHVLMLCVSCKIIKQGNL